MDIKKIAKELIDEGYIEGELSVHPLWYIIWEPENIDEYNNDYELSENAPGFTAFGSNGANELLVLDEAGVVYTIPTIGMEPQYADKVANNVSDLKQCMQK